MGKNKFWMLSVATLMICMFLFAGCSTNLTDLQYEKASDKALNNTYNVLVSDKSDLSTHGDFTYVNKSTSSQFNVEKNIWETTESVETYKRAGKGSSTIFEITEYQKSDDGLGVTDEITTKYIYTAITSEDTTNYYILKEYKENDEEVVKTIYKTFVDESEFVKAVYEKVAKELMKEIYNSFYYGGEKMLYSLLSNPEIKGTEDNCTFTLNFNSDQYSSSSYIIERDETEIFIEIKDAKFDNLKTTYSEYECGEKTQVSEVVLNLSYSAEISKISSIDAYAS